MKEILSQNYTNIEGNLAEVYETPKIEHKQRHFSHELKLALSGIIFHRNRQIAREARKIKK